MNKKILKKTLWLVIILAIIGIIGAFLINKTERQTKVCFNPPAGGCFDVELAQTPAQQTQGLMFRKSLAPDKGMLFVFDKEGNYPFWMKNTLISLDMVWINQNNEVVFIEKSAQPCGNENLCPTINSNQNAKYVLEINGGTAKKTGLELGDKIGIIGFTAE